MSRATFVLLPPSESKEPGGRLTATPGFFDERLDASRRDVLVALANFARVASREEFGRLLNVRGALLERALESTTRLVEGVAPVLPAWRRYNGVVWTHLDPASLPPRSRRRILVPSGLYGLSSGTDLIADYRMAMKIALPGVGALARFWRPSLASALEDIGGADVVNLLPREHDAAIGASDALSRRMISVGFVRHDGEGVAGHDAKAVKGVVARRVLTHGVAAVDGLEWMGWRGVIEDGEYLVRAPRIPERPSAARVSKRSREGR